VEAQPSTQHRDLVYIGGDHVTYNPTVDYFRILENNIVELVETKKLGAYPGRISVADWLSEELLVIGELPDGQSYIRLNGSDKLCVIDGSVIDYAIGDLDMDNIHEVVLLTQNRIYAINPYSGEILWSTRNNCSVDRVYVANITSPDYSLVVCWKNYTNYIVYYNYTGGFLNATALNASYSLNITQMYHVGTWLFAYSPSSHYLFYWEYGDTNASCLLDIMYFSPMAHSYGRIYSVAFGFGNARLTEIRSPIDYLMYDINHSACWMGFVTSARELLNHDIDFDGADEFLLCNGTLMALIDIVNQYEATQENTTLTYDDVSIIDGYVTVLQDDMLLFYDSDLHCISINSTICRRLTRPGSLAIAYDPYGHALCIRNPSDISTEYIDAGYNISIVDRHILIYNRHRIVDFWPNRMREYHIREPIHHAVPFQNDGFIIVWLNGSLDVYFNGEKIESLSIGIPNAYIADYDPINDILWIATTNNTLYNISQSITEYPLPGKCINLYAHGEVYYAVLTMGDSAVLDIFVNMDRVWSEQLTIPDLSGAYASFSISDVDDDGDFEKAYTLFVHNVSHARYILVVFGIYRMLGEHRYLSGVYPECMVFPFVDGFMFLEQYEGFIRVYYDGRNETYTLDGDPRWASPGVIASSGQIMVSTLGGAITLDVSDAKYCIGDFGSWTKTICVFGNTTVYNISCAIDTQEPYAEIHISDIVNASVVNVSFSVSDDLGVSSVFIKLDNGSWIDVTGSSFYTFHNVSEGNHTVYLNVTDLVGRYTSVSKAFVVDIPIDLMVFCPYNNSYTSETAIPILWDLSGPVDNLTITLNDTIRLFDDNPSESDNYSISIEHDGFWVIEIIARGYGDYLRKVVFVWVDTTPPSILVDPGNEITIETNQSTASIILHIHAEDNMALGYVVATYNSMQILNTTDKDSEIELQLGEGNHTVFIEAVDLAGNTGTVTVMIHVYNIYLELDVYCPYAWGYTNKTKIPVSWNITGNVDGLAILLNGDIVLFEENPPHSGTYILNISEGSWLISVVAYVRSNRVERSFVVHVDTTPPDVWTIPENTTIVADDDAANVTINIYARDNMGIDLIYVMYGDAILNTSKTNITLTILLAPGEYEFLIKATDLAGNTRTILLDIIVKTKQGGIETPRTSDTMMEQEKRTGPYGYIVIFALSLILGVIARRKGILQNIVRRLRRG